MILIVNCLLQNPSVAAVDGCINRSGKARVRARRGQATDPHSIAERVCVLTSNFLLFLLLYKIASPLISLTLTNAASKRKNF